MKDFKRYCENAHLQVTFLGWVTARLRSRQDYESSKGGSSDTARAITAIEEDFRQFCKEYKQITNFRFDRGDALLILATPLIVGGVESIDKIDSNNDKDNIISYIEDSLHCFQHFIGKAKILEPKGEKQPGVWTLIRRLRNSLSHFRYEYNPNTGEIQFQDFHGDKKTMDLTMPLMSVLNIAYRFGYTCVTWSQNNGHKKT